MFEISKLKTMKLPELQEIAKGLKVPKFKTLKKLDLVYQILDLQATNPKAVVAAATPVLEGKIVDRFNRSVLSYGDIIKTGTFKKLSEVFKIKNNLTLLKVKKL